MDGTNCTYKKRKRNRPRCIAKICFGKNNTSWVGRSNGFEFTVQKRGERRCEHGPRVTKTLFRLHMRGCCQSTASNSPCLWEFEHQMNMVDYWEKRKKNSKWRTVEIVKWRIFFIVDAREGRNYLARKTKKWKTNLISKLEHVENGDIRHCPI